MFNFDLTFYEEDWYSSNTACSVWRTCSCCLIKNKNKKLTFFICSKKSNLSLAKALKVNHLKMATLSKVQDLFYKFGKHCK